MKPDRRNFLRVAGSGAIILAAGSLAYSVTRDPASARRPWQEAGHYPDPVRNALSWALLAPNPHNRQPWLVDLRSETEAMIYVDTHRLLPHTDPFSRQITIGLGCFLELFRLASAQSGHHADITPFPDGFPDRTVDNRPIAHIKLSGTGQIDPLFAQAPNRRTNRSAYDPERPVAVAILEDIQAASLARPEISNTLSIGFTALRGRVESLRDLAHRAMEIELMTDATYMESVDLMRIGKDQINTNPDGISISGVVPEILNHLGPMSYQTLSDLEGNARQSSLDYVRHHAATAMAWVWFTTGSNTRLDQLKTGAAYLRAHLKATELGLAWHPMSQALQEFPEMSDIFDEIHQELAPDGKRIQMLARLGYAQSPKPSPRWPLNSRIIPT